MNDVALAAALLVAVLNGVAGLVGGWLWWRVTPRREALWLVRAGQGAAVLQACVAGTLALRGFDPDGLYWLYALLPVAVGFVAEQLRLAAAQAVLDTRGFESARTVGGLDDAGQRSVLRAVLRRELGVLATAAIVCCFLALRALAAL